MSLANQRNLNASMDAVIGTGMSCYWQPGYIPSDGYLAWERIFDLVISDALEEAGFDQTVTVQQHGNIRRMELLGEESPGEYVLQIVPVKRTDDGSKALEAMRQEMIRLRDCILACGELYRSQTLKGVMSIG